ncbi:M16 family metallopeptidase, partial [Thermodesulfobacteriota bacterium]
RTGQTPSRPAEPVQTSLRNIVIEDIVQQVNLNLYWHIPSLKHPHIAALDVMEIILGNGKSSRLYKRLRMDESLAHSVHTAAYSMADPGVFIVNSTLSQENLDKTLEAIASEVARITSEPVTNEELDRAKRLVEADFLFEMEEMTGQARTLGFFETMVGGLEKTDEYLQQIQAVTADDILYAANLYLKTSNLSIGAMIPEDTGIALPEDKINDIFSKASERYKDLRETPMETTDKPTIKYTLPNGLRIIIKENHRLPLVSIQAVMLGGMRLENPSKAGISNVAARMLTRGTKDRDAAQIAAVVDSWAGEMGGFSGRNSFGITANLLRKDLYPGLRLLNDLLLNSVFPESEIIKVKEDILASIRSKKESPSALLADLINETIYKNHPYGRPRIGTEETITSISREDLFKWYKSLAVPSNLVLTVVGDINKKEFLHNAEEIFSSLKSSSLNFIKINPEPPVTDIRETHLERKGAQIHLMIGYLGADLRSKFNAPMSIIDTALSGQGGRLFRELRDKQSLAYSVSSFRRPGLETGLFGVYIASEPNKLNTAKETLFEELGKIRTEGLTEEELTDAKKYLLGTQALGLQTNENQAMRMALDELYGLGYDHSKQYIKDIKEVTLKDLKQAVNEILKPDGAVISTVGPMP